MLDEERCVISLETVGVIGGVFSLAGDITRPVMWTDHTEPIHQRSLGKWAPHFIIIPFNLLSLHEHQTLLTTFPSHLHLRWL